jgi:hypothetical protein
VCVCVGLFFYTHLFYNLALPRGWARYKDEKVFLMFICCVWKIYCYVDFLLLLLLRQSNKFYYHCDETQESTWTKPTETQARPVSQKQIDAVEKTIDGIYKQLAPSLQKVEELLSI